LRRYEMIRKMWIAAAIAISISGTLASFTLYARPTAFDNIPVKSASQSQSFEWLAYLLGHGAKSMPTTHLISSWPDKKVMGYSVYVTAPLEVAKVFGRVPSCADADAELINTVALASINHRLDAAIAAATMATESGCNQFAVSSRGAIGLMQVMPRIWKDKYDFAGRVNLLNKADNTEVGVGILAGLVSEFGTAEGLRRYNGVGVGCDTCDGGYTSRILALARR
jgi:hypothetical protein